MVGLARGVGERGLDVVRLKVGKVAENFLVRHALGQHSEDVRHANAQSPDARPATALAGFHRDAFEEFHNGIVPRGDEKINCSMNSNLHDLFVFRHDDFGFRFHRAQGFGVSEAQPKTCGTSRAP